MKHLAFTALAAMLLAGCQETTQPAESNQPMFRHGPPSNPGRPSNPGPPDIPEPPDDVGPPDDPGTPTFCVAPPPDLVSWWPLDETSGTTAADLEGANPGTHMNGPVPVTGHVAGALSFDGTDDFVSAGTIASTVAGTMDAWIRPSGDYSGSQFVMGGLSADGADVNARFYLTVGLDIHDCQQKWLVALANGSLAQFACSGQLYNSTNFPDGVWTHIAATYDGTNVKFYKDGQSIATVAQKVSGAGNAQPFSIGRPGAFDREGFYYNGAIDEVEIFDRALSATEIQAIFDAGSAGKCKP